jgi:hypothetical protein
MVEDGAPVRRRRLGAHGTTPCLKALDRLDRHQTVASADQVYDDEARKKLMDKINRMAANFGIDENFAAAVQERLKTIGAIPDDAPSEGAATDSADSADFPGGANAAGATSCGAGVGSGFFLLQTAVTH